MNRFNNIFNKNEVENKLKDFKEGEDYSVFPTDEPNIKTYNFHNDKLRSVFRGDRVPVRITQEAYDGKDYTYRGHFEEGKDYRYSSQHWHFGDNYPTDPDGWKKISEWREEFGDSGDYIWGGIRGRRLGNDFEPKQIEVSNRLEELKWKNNQLTDKLKSLLARPESDFGVNGKWKKEFEVAEVKKDIADIEGEIEKEKNNVERFRPQHWETCECGRRFDKANDEHGTIENWKGRGGRDHFCSVNCAEKYSSGHPGEIVGKYPEKKVNNYSDLQKENQELRQELSEVKNQLAQVLDELKKLKRDINGKDSEKLERQIVQNEKLIKESENISVSEVQEQVNKSQALMKEFNISSTQDNKGNGSLPYVIGGSVILASAGIIGYFLLKKNKRK